MGRVGAECKILIAVKANAYGHGAVEAARLAERTGVDWLGVATVPEGREQALAMGADASNDNL